MWFLNEWLYPFIARIINIHGSGVLVALCGCCMAGATWNASSVYTIQPCTSLQCHFIQSHIGRVYACLAVTCNLHFWQNDQDLLRATAVTRGWNGYRNRVSTESWPWRRKFSRRSCRDSKPGPLDHESDTLTTELSPLSCVSWLTHSLRAQKLCESRGGRYGFSVPHSPYRLCGRKATLNLICSNRTQKLCENRGGRPGPHVPNKPDIFTWT